MNRCIFFEYSFISKWQDSDTYVYVSYMLYYLSWNCIPLTGRPAPLSECRILNMSQPSIKVGCQEGFDGGLPQTFLLEVYENEQLKTKMTNQEPFFDISQVDYGQPVKLFVFAQNAKGTSEPFIIEETFGKARQQAVEGKIFQIHICHFKGMK